MTKKKTLLGILLTLCLMVGALFTLTACDKHKHNFGDDFLCDCGAVSDKAVVKIKEGEEFRYVDYFTTELVDSLEDGDELTLMKDYTIEKPISIDVNVLIDFGGHKLSSQAGGFDLAYRTQGTTLKLQNGTLETQKWGVWVQNKGEVTVAQNCTIIANKVDATTNNAITIEDADSKAYIYGTLKAEGLTAVLSANGTEGKGGYTIEINDGAKIEGGEIGIYMQNIGTLNIGAATITADSALYIKCGTTTINGATLHAKGAKADYENRSNGATSTGDAICVDAMNYPGGEPTVTITNATITSEHGNEIGVYLVDGHNATINNSTSYDVVSKEITTNK